MVRSRGIVPLTLAVSLCAVVGVGDGPVAPHAADGATMLADFDVDGDVDLTDFGHFQACFNGPNRGPATEGCSEADFDQDGDVDLEDFSFFQLCYNGPNRPPTLNPTQSAKLLSQDIAPSDEFGRTVSISGDYALMGAHFDGDRGYRSGSAYVFKRDGSLWTQEAKLTASDGAAGDWFGHVVAISGDRALVGAPYDDDRGTDSGSAFVFRRDGAAWAQEGKLLASDGAANDEFGFCVAIDGDRCVVGASRHGDALTEAGAAYVYRRDGTSWAQDAKLTAPAPAPYDRFGMSVGISGDRAVIGSYLDDSGAPDAGAAYVFRRDPTGWVLEARLIAADAVSIDFFGWSVGISGDYAVVGAFLHDAGASDAGAACVFHRDGTSWTQTATLIASDAAAQDFFGFAVSISGDYAVIGSYADDDMGTQSGSAYVFRRIGARWVQVAKLVAPDAAAGDQFGQAVSVSGVYALIGAPLDNDGGSRAGSAYVYTIVP